MVVAAACMGMLAIIKDWGVFQDKKIYGLELSTGKILEENLVYTAFRQTLGDEFTIQQDNNLPKAQGLIYTGVAYQEDSEYS
jgi:hypothetical protein